MFGKKKEVKIVKKREVSEKKKEILSSFKCGSCRRIVPFKEGYECNYCDGKTKEIKK